MQALAGIRVVDFSWVRAGPWATRWLGAFGAEIIKIEWPENERGRLPSSTTPQQLEVDLNTSGNFNDTNVNKKSLSLNVRTAKGLDIVKRLIAISDFVSPKIVPGWADAEDVVTGFTPKEGVHYTGLWFNAAGLERVLQVPQQVDDHWLDLADRLGRVHAKEPASQPRRECCGDEKAHRAAFVTSVLGYDVSRHVLERFIRVAGPLTRHLEDALADDVALDLVRAAGD
jgi:hypothetical protein